MNNLGFKAGDLVYCLSKDTKIHRLVPNYEDEFVGKGVDKTHPSASTKK